MDHVSSSSFRPQNYTVSLSQAPAGSLRHCFPHYFPLFIASAYGQRVFHALFQMKEQTPNVEAKLLVFHGRPQPGRSTMLTGLGLQSGMGMRNATGKNFTNPLAFLPTEGVRILRWSQCL